MPPASTLKVLLMGVSDATLSPALATLLRSKGSSCYSNSLWVVECNEQWEEDGGGGKGQILKGLVWPAEELGLGEEQWKSHKTLLKLSPLGRYSIRRTSDKGQFFGINKHGNIYNVKELDREVYPWYNLTVEAKELDSRGEWSHFPEDLGSSPSLILPKSS